MLSPLTTRHLKTANMKKKQLLPFRVLIDLVSVVVPVVVSVEVSVEVFVEELASVPEASNQGEDFNQDREVLDEVAQVPAPAVSIAIYSQRPEGILTTTIP